MPSPVDLSQCEASCHGHGICAGWPAEPRFPPHCVCEPQWAGTSCEIRKPNPYLITTEAKKYQTWQRSYGVACGVSHQAVSCDACGATAEACGADGDCAWKVHGWDSGDPLG